MGEGDGVEADGGSGIAQRVAGARVLQLVDGADVARAQLGDGDLLLAADEVDVLMRSSVFVLGLRTVMPVFKTPRHTRR